MRSPELKSFFGLVLGAAFLALTFSLWTERSRESAVAVLAADASAIRKMCRRAAIPAGDFLERLKAMGVEALWSSPVSLRELAQEGGLLYFSKEEVEKWKMTGFLSPSSSLRPHSLWVLNPGPAGRIFGILKDSGILSSSRSVSGYTVFNLSQSIDLDSFSLAGGRELEEEARSAGIGWLDSEPSALCRAKGGPGLKKEVLNLIEEHGCEVVAVSFREEDGVEESLARLRETVRAVKEGGFISAPKAEVSSASRALRIALAVLLGIASPWAALRLGRRVLAACGESRVLEILSPVREPAAGFLAAAGASVLCGGALHVLLTGAGDFGPELHRIRAWWLILPFAVFLRQEAGMGLSDLASFFKGPVLWKHLAAPVLAACAVFQPEDSAAFLGFPALALGLWKEAQGLPSKALYAAGLWGIVYAMDASSLPHRPFWASLHHVLILTAKGAAVSLPAAGLWQVLSARMRRRDANIL